MSHCVSHRCLTIVMRRMFCQRSTLRVGNSCYITAVITCRWVPLCSVALSRHVLSLAKNLLWRMSRFTKSKSHLQQIPPISSILPQLCAHGAFKTTKQLVAEFLLSLTLHQIIPPLHPLSSPPAVSGAPGLGCPQHPRRHPRRGAAPRRRRGR